VGCLIFLNTSCDNNTHINLNDSGWIYSVAENAKGMGTGTRVFILSLWLSQSSIF